MNCHWSKTPLQFGKVQIDILGGYIRRSRRTWLEEAAAVEKAKEVTITFSVALTRDCFEMTGPTSPVKSGSRLASRVPGIVIVLRPQPGLQ